MSGTGSSGARDTKEFWEGQELDPRENLEQVFDLMEMFFSNADRISWNPEHEFDPESTYAKGYRERGAPEPLVPILSLFSQIFEPDLIGLVGDLARVPRVWGAVNDTARAVRRGVDPNEVYSVVRDARGNPITSWRAQQAGGGGVGPIATDLNLPPSNARYHGEFGYVSDMTRGNRPGVDFIYREGSPRARPGGVLDLHGTTGTDPSDVFNRIEPAAMDMVPPQYRELLQRDFDEYRRGYISGQDLMESLRDIFGTDLARHGDLPARSRLDALFQGNDDGRGRMLEIVTFGKDKTWIDRNLYTAEELIDLIPKKGR